MSAQGMGRSPTEWAGSNRSEDLEWARSAPGAGRSVRRVGQEHSRSGPGAAEESARNAPRVGQIHGIWGAPGPPRQVMFFESLQNPFCLFELYLKSVPFLFSGLRDPFWVPGGWQGREP